MLFSSWVALVACTRSVPEGGQRSRHDVTPSTAPMPLAAARQPDAATATPLAARQELSWSFARGPFGVMDVAVSIPAGAPGQRFPVLVALHGRGESAKGSAAGARAWLDDYQLNRALGRLAQPPLTVEDFEGYIAEGRLSELNRDLGARPYAGLILVFPYLADVLRGEAAFDEAERLATFITDELLPRVYRKTPAIGTAPTTGIDGVSLGGRAALLVGLKRPRAFGSVGGLQPAFDAAEVERLAELAEQARRDNPLLALRLLTSDEDYYRATTERLSVAFSSRGVAHVLARGPGTHSYRFNRGPGGYEMLLFHDRALRGLPPL